MGATTRPRGCLARVGIRRTSPHRRERSALSSALAPEAGGCAVSASAASFASSKAGDILLLPGRRDPKPILAKRPHLDVAPRRLDRQEAAPLRRSLSVATGRIPPSDFVAKFSREEQPQRRE
jgi:hypothetical protein